MINNKINKTKALLFVLLFYTTLSTIRCAPSSSNDGDWASGNPDSSVVDQPYAQKPNIPNDPSVPVEGLFFSLLPGVFKLAHGPGIVWNGCDKNAKVQGGYDSDTTCGHATLYPGYADHLNKYFFGCVDKAAADAGYEQPQKVFLRHLGTYVDRNARNSTELSMHAYGRAIDIAKFILYDRLGAVTQVSTNLRDFKGATVKFYNSFRECWKETLPSTCRPGDREYVGSIGIPKSALGGNDLHNDHIHLSFPLCAG
ncbi:MAG: hypothetical protein ACXVCP_18410 [Bdellovibrio sp.]